MLSVFLPTKGVDYKVKLDKTAFNDMVVKLAREVPADHPAKSFFVYIAAKTEVERAAWKWIEAEKPSFQFNAVLPTAVFGEAINPNSRDASSTRAVNTIVKTGDASELLQFMSSPQYFVDVKDVARIHVAALVEPDVQNERLLAVSAPYSLNELMGYLRSFPKNSKIPKDFEGYSDVPIVQVDTTRSTELLKRQGRTGWVSLKDSLWEQVKHL